MESARKTQMQVQLITGCGIIYRTHNSLWIEAEKDLHMSPGGVIAGH